MSAFRLIRPLDGFRYAQANAADLAIRDVALFFSLADGQTFEVTVNELTFRPLGTTTAVGGSGTTSDGVVSIRRGNGTNWIPILGSSPVGTWTLALPDTPDVRAHFTEGHIQDIVFALSVAGTAAPWSVVTGVEIRPRTWEWTWPTKPRSCRSSTSLSRF